MRTKINHKDIKEEPEEMMKEEIGLLCPHCGVRMKKWMTPHDSSWNTEYQYVCFNDECSYFVRGWQWMNEKYGAHSSYRHRYDPETGKSGPVPVGSYSALKGDIIEEENEGD